MSKFALFNTTTVTYKTVNTHEIQLDVVVPKGIIPGAHPIILRFHGGALITGTSLFEDWFPTWIIELARSRSVIIVSPNYRLLPESNGKDILSDLEDAWSWVQSPTGLKDVLTSITQSRCEPDLARVIVTGESSGGLLAMQLGMTAQPGTIRAIIAHYPPLDLRAPWLAEPGEKHPMGFPTLPESIIDDYVAAMPPGSVISSAPPPMKVELMVSIMQHGRCLEFLGDETEVYPIDRLNHLAKANIAGRLMPPLWVLHGNQDTFVPVDASMAFVRRLQELRPNAEVLVSLKDGDHYFDKDFCLDNEWLKDGLDFVNNYWLK